LQDRIVRTVDTTQPPLPLIREELELDGVGTPLREALKTLHRTFGATQTTAGISCYNSVRPLPAGLSYSGTASPELADQISAASLAASTSS